jgi:7,8-dihydropterin-6-yl-methyl-4-(beta-D-ribofuranosyl)aminobenzene 5'-phosphate synthase
VYHLEEAFLVRKCGSLISRREALLGGVAFAGCRSLNLSAAPLIDRVPQIDGLVISVLVDNQVFGPFLPAIERSDLLVERQTRGMGRGIQGGRMTANTLLAEFGFSVLAESQVEGQLRRVLIDFGYSPQALANNVELMGVNLTNLDAAVLSHGHLDHYGGIGALAAIGIRQGVPLIVGGEEAFCQRSSALRGSPPFSMGALDRSTVREAGFEVQIRSMPEIIGDHAWTTGEIPLTGSERAAIPTRMEPGKGCDIDQLSNAKQAVEAIDDDGEHELATCYAIRDKGLVVITSCGHRGVINSIRQAQVASGIDKVHAVIGGFHLVAPRTAEEAMATVDAFEEIDPDYIVPMHCTGEAFIAEASKRMPEKVIRPYVGSRFHLGVRA